MKAVKEVLVQQYWGPWFNRGHVLDTDDEEDDLVEVRLADGSSQLYPTHQLFYCHKSDQIEVGDSCMAACPERAPICPEYAPAIVERVDDEGQLLVRLIQDICFWVSSCDVLPVSRTQHRVLSERVQQRQRSVLDRHVLAVACSDLLFHKGLIKTKNDDLNSFKVWWPNGSTDDVCWGAFVCTRDNNPGSRRSSEVVSPEQQQPVGVDHDGNDVGRGDAVLAPHSSIAGAYFMSRVFAVDPVCPLLSLVTPDSENVRVAAADCYRLSMEQYRLVCQQRLQCRADSTQLQLPSNAIDTKS